MSDECSLGRHATCPGYYKMAHPCGCPCHRPKSSESLGRITPQPSIFGSHTATQDDEA